MNDWSLELVETGAVKKIILDTDIGDDIDDALALALALNLDSLDLQAVVTVYDDVETRSRIAAKVLRAAGRPDIPVATGLADPIKNRPPHTGWIEWQARVLTEDEEFEAIVSTPGPEFIRDILEESREPMSLVAIGPLTNIARVLTDYPSTKKHIKEIVIMGGLFGRNGPEHNIHIDPEAAQTVFDARLPTRIIPLDITEKCLMGDALLRKAADDGRPLLRLMADLIACWQEGFGRAHPVLHDPLAIGCLAAPELYTFERVDVGVRLEPGELYGAVVGARNDDSPLQVCSGVKYDAFLDLFASHALDLRDGGQDR